MPKQAPVLNFVKNGILYLLLVLICVFICNSVDAQTFVYAQLQGSPVNTSNWSFQGSAAIANIKNIDNSEILLCPAQGFKSGAIFYNRPINLSVCNTWSAEFDFRIFDGSMADGIAFCFLDVPPVGFVVGGGMGIPATAKGLKVCFDPNPNCAPFATNVMPKIEIRWGAGYDECWNQPTVQNIGGILSFIRSDNYNHAKITYDSGNISVYVNNTLYLTGFQQFNFSGYMGFTASTGGRTDNHSIKNVTIYTDMPPSDAGAPQQICSGSAVQLGTAPNNTYAYSWTPATGLSATNIANPMVTLTNSTSSPLVQKYYVQTAFSNNTGCTSIDSVLVTVNPAPAVTISASANTVCAGSPVIFTAAPGASTGNSSYLWYKNGVSTGITTATYSSNTFQDNDQVSCILTSLQCNTTSNLVTLKVNPNQVPSIAISASSINSCEGNVVTFNAVVMNGGSAPVFQWMVNGINTGLNNTTYVTSALSNHDIITCKLTSNAVCTVPVDITSNSISMSVTALKQPNAAISATSATICKGSPDTFKMTVNNGSALTYQWKVNGVKVGIDSTFTADNLADLDKISCDVVVNTPCLVNVALSDTFTINVTPDANPAINISTPSNTVCQGTPVIFNAMATNAGNNINYQWLVNQINAGTDNSVFVADSLQNSDVVTCRITLKNIPCLLQNTLLSNSLPIAVSPLPQVSLPASESITAGNGITLQPIVSNNVIQYLWSPATGLSNPVVQNPVANPEFNTIFTLTVTTAGNCNATATTEVKVIKKQIAIFNTFTPNADGRNDAWVIPDLMNYPASTVDIYTRWGARIFHSIGYSQPWDGLFNGKPVPAGVYYYIVDLKDGSKPIAGFVTLLR